MFEYINLIHREKQEALRNYDEEGFRLRLDRKISEEKKTSRSYVLWFQKPAIAGSTVLLLISLIWLSARFFHPSSQAAEATRMKNTFVQLFQQHETLLNFDLQPIEQESQKSTISEFQWSVKRVLYAIQRENAPDADISESISRVLHNVAASIKTEKDKNDRQNI